MQVVPTTPGMQGFDTDTSLDIFAQDLAAAGFGYAIRYLSRTIPENPSDLTADEVNTILSAKLGLMAVQHVPKPGWSPTGNLGNAYGQAAVTNAKAAGLPPGMSLWCDLEGVAPYTTAADTIAYVNGWAKLVASAGYLPGLYVGANQPLSGDDLYWRLVVKRYWKSASTVPDIPYRGYCMVQALMPAPFAGVSIDRDVAMADNFGGVPMMVTA